MFAILCVLLAAAAPGDVPTVETDRQLHAIAVDYLNGYYAFSPQTAVELGLHQFDGKQIDLSQASLAREHARLKKFDKLLNEFPVEKLSDPVKADYAILQTGIRESLFTIEEKDAYATNPMTYARAITPNTYLSRNWAPLDSRVKSIIALEKDTPQVFQAARANLKKPLPRVLVETAIKVSNGAAEFLEKELPEATKDVKDKSLLVELKASNAIAIREFRDYATWLEKEHLPHAQVRFAWGRDKFIKMLRDQEMVSQTPEEILRLGMAELKREQAIFNAAAKRIDPNKPGIETFTAIQEDHPTAQSLIPETAKSLEMIRKFVLDKKICSIPSEVRAVVAETPSYRRAVSFASMSSPGVFEKVANEAYYYVTPVDQKWTAVQQNEWLTAFNYYTTDVVSIHETYPGHYVQHLHLNMSPVHDVRKVFGSYAFVEGWAHYTEQMLLDEGFPGGDDALKIAKYRLAQSDESLLRLCRLCVAIQMHCGDMTVDEATKFFQENCYYLEQPARQEATRGTYDPGYLNYALGKLMIFKLRADWQKQEGDKYTIGRFHDTMLGQGAPPLPLLRRIMLKDRAIWEKAL